MYKPLGRKGLREKRRKSFAEKRREEKGYKLFSAGEKGKNLSAGRRLFPALPGESAGLILAPIPMGILNLYFGLFSAYVQTTVYAFLCALWFAAERPEEEAPALVPDNRQLLGAKA